MSDRVSHFTGRLLLRVAGRLAAGFSNGKEQYESKGITLILLRANSGSISGTAIVAKHRGVTRPCEFQLGRDAHQLEFI